MATVFMETPDATQGKEFWSSVTGTVTYDTTASVKKSGLASWKCASGGGNAAANLIKNNILPFQANTGYRVTGYFCLTHLPTATTPLCRCGLPDLRVTSAGVLQLWNSLTPVQIGSDGSTISAGTVYRFCITVLNNASGQVGDVKLFKDGVQDISVTGLTISANDDLSVGWLSAPGASKILNFQHIYVDDSTALTDTGDMRVTAKLPTTVNNNGFDTAGGTGAVNERALSETNYKRHAAASAVNQDYNLETAAGGDVNISGDTLVAYGGWIWAARGAGAATVHQLRLEGLLYAITLTTSGALHNKIVDSTTYPTNAAAIGLNRDAGAQDSYLYECGVLCAYKVAAGSVNVTPGTASLTTNRFTPTVQAPRVVTPGIASLVTTRLVPTIVMGVSVTPGVASLLATRFAPAVALSDNKNVAPGVAALATTRFTPTVAVTLNQFVTPGVASLTTTRFTPTVGVNRELVPGVASLTTVRFTPTVQTPVGVTPGVVALTTTRFLPATTVSDNKNVVPGAVALTTTRFTPIVTVSITIAGGPPAPFWPSLPRRYLPWKRPPEPSNWERWVATRRAREQGDRK